MKLAKLKMGRSTRYDAKMVSVPHGIAARPRWTVEVQCVDMQRYWREFGALSHEMRSWCDDNLTNHRIHLRSAMGSIEAVTFRKHADAMLFYMRFV